MSQPNYPLNLFVPNKWNYNILTDEEFNELVEDTRVNGIREKIVVRRKGEQLEVINGTHRIRALKTIGSTDIPAEKVEVHDSMTDSEARAYIRSSKTRGSKKDLIKEAFMVLEDVNDLKSQNKVHDFKEYSAYSGIEYTKLVRMLNRCNMPSGAQQLVSQGNISASVLDELLSVRPDYSLSMIRRAIDENWTVEQAKFNVKAGVTVTGEPVRGSKTRKDSDLNKLDMYDRAAITKFLESYITAMSDVSRYCESKGAVITMTGVKALSDKANKVKNLIEGSRVVYPYNPTSSKVETRNLNDVRDWVVAGTEDERKAKIAEVEVRMRVIGGKK